MDAQLEQIKQEMNKKYPKSQLPPDSVLWREAISKGFAVMRAELNISQAATKKPTQAAKQVEKARQLIRAMREDEHSYQAIADKLNSKNIPTPSGEGEWHPASVRRLAGSLGT